MGERMDGRTPDPFYKIRESSLGGFPPSVLAHKNIIQAFDTIVKLDDRATK